MIAGEWNPEALPPRWAVEGMQVSRQDMFVLETMVAGGDVTDDAAWHQHVDEMWAAHRMGIIFALAARISGRMRIVQVGLTGQEGFEFPRKTFDHLIGRQDPQVRRDYWTVLDSVFKQRRPQPRLNEALRRLEAAAPRSVYGLAETSLVVGIALADMDPNLTDFHDLLQRESAGLEAHSLEQLARYEDNTDER